MDCPKGTSVIPRILTLYVDSTLCIVQFVWTHCLERTTTEWMFVAVAMALASTVFSLLYRLGRRPVKPSVK